jgi:hypothetical protein
MIDVAGTLVGFKSLYWTNLNTNKQTNSIKSVVSTRLGQLFQRRDSGSALLVPVEVDVPRLLQTLHLCRDIAFKKK